MYTKMEMSAEDRNVQVAIAASNVAAATASTDGTDLQYLLKQFDKAYNHILAKTRPVG